VAQALGAGSAAGAPTVGSHRFWRQRSAVYQANVRRFSGSGPIGVGRSGPKRRGDSTAGELKIVVEWRGVRCAMLEALGASAGVGTIESSPD
jgi:hypothetical protein